MHIYQLKDRTFDILQIFDKVITLLNPPSGRTYLDCQVIIKSELFK
jgi:hypothetical protein